MEKSWDTFRGNSEKYLVRLGRVLASLDRSELDAGIARIAHAWQRGAQIITLGNGGSATTALHFATDWGKMVPLATGRPLYARSLIDNVGLITAYANDLSYADVFCQQLRFTMRPGDLVIAVSGSGNSENVIRAVDYANANQGETIGLVGFSGGRLRERVATPIWVRSNDMQLCEDAHAIFGHIVMQALCGIGSWSDP